MRTDGIEIAQNGSMQVLVGMRLVADNFFVDLLGVTIGRERFLYRRRLIYRQMRSVRLAINGARIFGTWYNFITSSSVQRLPRLFL